MTCTCCKRDLPTAARGLCRACYSRWNRTGTTDHKPRPVRRKCQIGGCGRRVVSNGLCDTHRKRLERHGHTDQTRPDSWGAIQKHPLRNAWNYLHRHRGRITIAGEWKDDFLRFAVDVGERPSPAHKLFAADESKPIGPGNFVWKRAITERVEGEDSQTYRNRQQRVYRSVRKEAFKDYDLKRLFGLSFAEYEKLLDKQDGCCAICGERERLTIRGKVTALAVDHCHKNGVVRGLLCSKCNQGLGCFRDDTELLTKAIDYLRWPARLL